MGNFYKNKGNLRMVDLQTDITNTLNHNGYDEVRITNVDKSFSIRVGYWEQLSTAFIKNIEEYHSVRITETTWEDEDCGELFSYFVEIIDEESGYTLDELNELDSNYSEDEDSYLAEAEFLHKYESGDVWGIA